MAASRGSAPTNWRRSSPARSDVSGPRERQRGLLYGRRKGPKPSARQAALFEALLPKLKLDLQDGLAPQEYFQSRVTDVWLEIGFGAGEHLLWQAEHHSNIGIIGAEPYEAGVAKLLSKLAHFLPHTCAGEEISAGEYPQFISRLRIYEGDARDIIEALPDASLGRVFVLFPDPWPKKRHHKRRFIQTGTIDTLARVMKPDAEIRLASDDPDYVAWSLECFRAHESFEWTAERAPDWRTRAADWPPTRYEQKALRGEPVFLRFRRRALQIAGAKRT
jgi:tRNA (guanine-N7-)-methyltransferase